MKTLFKEFDKDKKGITRDSIILILSRLNNDECVIGKVPCLQESEYEGVLSFWPEKVTWEYFRNNCN